MLVDATGAGNLRAGAEGHLRLTRLSETLRTPADEAIDLEVAVVGKQPGGFTLRFLSGAEALMGLLERAAERDALTDAAGA